MTTNIRIHRSLQRIKDRFFGNKKPSVPASDQLLNSGDAGSLKSEVSGSHKPRKEKAAGPWQLARRLGCILVLVLLLAGLIGIGIKGLQVYRMLQVVRGDFNSLEKLNISSMNSDVIEQAGPLLDKTHNDIETARNQMQPWLGWGWVLEWVPVYGGDLKYSSDLLEMSSDLTLTASQTYKTTLPILSTIDGNQGDLQASDLIEELVKSQPAFSDAQVTLGKAVLARQRININELSPSTSALLRQADAYLSGFNDGLSLAIDMPALLGAGSGGSKTYLILIQNEDELRPTGGFITAVATMVVGNGGLISWNIVDSYSLDDINKAYPDAPWQMQSFMNIPIMTFHDSNWSPDFPTTVMWTRYLYAYSNTSSLNGVIAIDQHVLKTLLSVTGPIFVGEINALVTSDNVEQVMRIQKMQPAAALRDPSWSRKQFMTPITGAVLNKILTGQGFSWEALLKAMTGELDQRHILMDLDDPALATLLTRHGWDGTVARSDGDFLMVVDTNVGYNKTNAVVSPYFFYSIDLTDPTKPTSNLAVVHHNAAQGPGNQCAQRSVGTDLSEPEYWYPIDRCYYDYLRTYLPAGTQLKDAAPHAVSRDEMIMLDQNVPPRVDILDDSLPGLQGFGTLLVTPMGQNVETDFQFNLPAGILTSDLKLRDLIYQLKVQKQAGTGSTPIMVSVHLPQASKIKSVSPEGSITDGRNLLFKLVLSEDVNIRIEFHP